MATICDHVWDKDGRCADCGMPWQEHSDQQARLVADLRQELRQELSKRPVTKTVHKKVRAAVEHPPHYGGGDNPYEAIKVIKACGWLEAFCKGNAMKYLMRAGRKQGESELQDLRKAAWYLTYLANSIDPELDN